MINYRNENGITFIVLVMTVIVLLIIATVSINIGLDGIGNTIDKQDLSILYMVQQAALGKYSQASSLGNNGKVTLGSSGTTQYYGKKIEDLKTIEVDKLSEHQVNEFKLNLNSEAYDENGKIKEYSADEDYYYRLETEDLKKLKITKPGDVEDASTSTEISTDTFIVNYKTGEVYNETKQITGAGSVLYIEGKSTEKNKEIDNTSFNDF